MKPHYIITRDGRFVCPFRFEDLNGKPEPETWGPRYSKPPKPDRKRWREPPSFCASGQPFEFNAAKHRAKLKAEFVALANADKRAWANNLTKSCLIGTKNMTIQEAYKAAMATKV